MKASIDQLKKEWREENAPLGRECGFPECCINAFCNQPPVLLQLVGPNSQDHARFKAAKINGKFTGFIPCYKHAVQINSGAITLQSLVNNRNPKLPPFPLFGNHE